ncbi:MAG: glycerophosphodiester phosphodiesterase [Bacteroidales bacterium]|nr:glycerophosphodiester phosphodiesterase [Bacteroidales bacterium]
MNIRLITAATAFAFFGTLAFAAEPPADEGGCAQTEHGIAIAAHRGYWNCEESGYARNTVASLRNAQTCGFWGSEFDLHLTTDEVIVVVHDDVVDGVRIDANPYSAIKDVVLENGEKIPTLDDYLAQAVKNPKVMLVCEFKKHSSEALEDRLIELTVAKMKEYGVYDPGRVMFISFSRHVSDVVAEKMPEFTNQYLDKNFSPDELAETGINGVDYSVSVFKKHPDWYRQARDHGMSVNCWTVNKREDIEMLVDLGVDCITSDYPTLVREILSEKGIKEL